MKKPLIIIVLAFIVVMSILGLLLVNIRNGNKRMQQINIEYEYYLNKKIYGTELATLINKAIENNKKYEVKKNEKGLYINNETSSILITIEMIQTKETYHMEQIYALGTEQFVNLFNSSVFESDKVTYHEKNGRIAEILFKQVVE